MRARVYIMLTLVVLFVQVFVLNNLSISPLVAPMVYIVILLMMPIEFSQWKMLGAGLLLGVVMDLTMGTAGLNTLVTLPIAFFRRPLLYALTGLSPMSKEEGIPTIKRLGVRFHRYFAIVIVLHSLLFYFAEWLSFDNFGTLLLRILCSTLCSLLLDYIIIMLFMKRLSA
ncbi:MAG: rod shape-determining protein MreD [Rikenellaceae bacterium]|nr:rod shape-determining protein MreD [Rikenellaceae bacterium]